MINLLALLVQRTQPLTLKQIRQELVNQYPDGDSAARAAFERDKAQLRALGIPMDMVTLGGDKAGEGAYTVDRRQFEIGDLGLNDAERSALQMAIATVRIGASHGDEALWKLGGERALDRPSTSVNIQMDDRQLPALAAGVVEHRTLNFVYKGQQRQVDPYGLLSRGGFWYIVGFDHLRNAQRVKAEFGDGAVLRERSDGSIEFAIPCANMNAFRVWLFAMVDRAEVLGPPRVREHIVKHLQQIAGNN